MTTMTGRTVRGARTGRASTWALTAIIPIATVWLPVHVPAQNPVPNRNGPTVPVTENSRPALRGPAAWRIASAPTLTIGARDGAGGTVLYRIVDAVRLSDGRITAWSAGDQALLYFDESGRFLRSVGGEGGGPGEFRAGYGLTRLPGDSVCLYDLVQQRVTFFDEAGNLAGVVSFRPPEPLRSALYVGRLRDGSHLIREGVNPLHSGAGPGLHRTEAWISRYGPTGRYLGRVLRFRGAETLVTGRGAGSAPFGRTTLTVLSPPHLVIGFADSWSLDYFNLDGDLEKVVTKDVEPSEVTDADIDRYEGRLRRRTSQGSQPLADLEFPETHPVFDHALADAQGNVWVRQHQPAATDAPSTWSIFGPGGEWLTDVQTPARYRLTDVGDDYVLGVWRDELDVQVLRVYELVKPKRTR